MILLGLMLLSLVSTTAAFSPPHFSATSMATQHPFCTLPGDPSLILTTNIDLGDKKMDNMKGTSACTKLFT
jgi:hypothetical protein